MSEYKPQPKTAAILARALSIVGSVPYRVSARWVFYRLLQEGFYASKDDYKNKFLPAVSDARHAQYSGWTPFTLADETRAAIVRGNGFNNPGDWLLAVARAECELDRWQYQPNYVELWYEARAMTDQFRFYTQYITLRPMGGQPSIPYKAETAKQLSEAYQRYGKPISVLYFGDLDKAGATIADVVEQDVRKWCECDFQFVHCGLNESQVMRYDLPENFDHPGSYQWEALTDNAAREIITGAMSDLVDIEAFSVVTEKEQAVMQWFSQKAAQLAVEWASK